MLDDERVELTDQVVVAPASEICLDPQLEREQPDLFETGNGGLGEARIGEVAERRAPPQRQCAAQPIRRRARYAALEEGPALFHQSRSKRSRSSA